VSAKAVAPRPSAYLRDAAAVWKAAKTALARGPAGPMLPRFEPRRTGSD
jgi:hypothetical protein